jgi:hypothetical protein
MPTASVRPKGSGVPLEQQPGIDTRKAGGVIAWSSFLFAVLQSVCTFFAAVDGLRVAIGVGALVLGAGVGGFVHQLHSDLIRLPMIGLALVGSLLNLVVLWQVRRLRSNPAAQWRQRPLSAGKIRVERVQLVLSILTLVLVGIEEYWHIRWHHHV